METKSFKVEVIAHATPQGLPLGFLNSVVSIRQSWEIEELLVDENHDGNITSLGSYPDPSFPDKPSVLLGVQDFAPTTIHQLIHRRFNDPLLSRLVTDGIVVESRRRDLPRGAPLLMTVLIKFTKKNYVVLPCNSAPPTTRVEEESCAICLEDMSVSEQETKPLCQPPGCVHVFHEDCFVQWLDRHDSCPLCRLSTTTNPLTNKPSRALEELTEA